MVPVQWPLRYLCVRLIEAAHVSLARPLCSPSKDIREKRSKGTRVSVNYFVARKLFSTARFSPLPSEPVSLLSSTLIGHYERETSVFVSPVLLGSRCRCVFFRSNVMKKQFSCQPFHLSEGVGHHILANCIMFPRQICL